MRLAQLIVLGAAAAGGNGGDASPAQDRPESERSLPNLSFPTLGGCQFWGDVHWRADWPARQRGMGSAVGSLIAG